MWMPFEIGFAALLLQILFIYLAHAFRKRYILPAREMLDKVEWMIDDLSKDIRVPGPIEERLKEIKVSIHDFLNPARPDSTDHPYL